MGMREWFAHAHLEVNRYPSSGVVASGAVYGRRLLAEPELPIGIAGVGPYLPPSVLVPPVGIGGFGRRLAGYYGCGAWHHTWDRGPHPWTLITKHARYDLAAACICGDA